MTDTVSPPGSHRWLMLPVVLLAMFMAGFDIWVVNVAAPSLQRDLHVSDAALQLIVGGYAFMYASGMVTGGRLGDLVGYRRMPSWRARSDSRASNSLPRPRRCQSSTIVTAMSAAYGSWACRMNRAMPTPRPPPLSRAPSAS